MKLTEITNILNSLADGHESMRVGSIVESFGSRGYGPFLIIPALFEMSPIGGVPGVPTALAIIVLLVALQLLLGRKHLWLPDFVNDRKLNSGKVKSAVARVEPTVQKLDSWFSGTRAAALTYSPFTQVAAGICILLALSVPPLELIPFASTAPMAAIALIGTAIMVHNGLLMIAALLVSLLSFTAVGLLII